MDKRLNIEVRGIGFPNKGAELMLAALCEKIYGQFSFAKIVLPPVANYKNRTLLGTFQLGKVEKFGLDFGILLRVIPAKMRNMFGIVMPSEIDVIIDASGFAYGDQWGSEKAQQRLGGNIVKFKGKASNRKVIMLPQALGTFEDATLQQQMRIIFDNCDLVFARDSDSLEFANALCETTSVKQAPDFTNLFSAVYQGKQQIPDKAVCMIPNAKMLQMKQGQDPQHYIRFMSSLLKTAFDTGTNCFVLVHEGIGDLKLAKTIVEDSGCPVEIIKPDTAADVKAVIGQAKLVISSRFHGLVSALSQGVPVIATGWSHKYQMLLQDYDMGEYLFNEETQTEEASIALSALLKDEMERHRVAEHIKCQSELQKQLTEAMWEEVYAVLKSAVHRDVSGA